MNDLHHDEPARQRIDTLDRLIDLGNAGRPIPPVADPELGPLLATVAELRRLRPAPPAGEDGFPELLAARLSDELRADARRRTAAEGGPMATLPDRSPQSDDRMTSPPPGAPVALARERASRRQWLQMAAAIVAFVAIGALLVALLRGDDGSDDGRRAGVAGVGNLPTADTSYRSFSGWDEALTFARTVADYEVVVPWFAAMPARLDEVVVGPISQDGRDRDVYVIATYVTQDGATALEFTQGYPSCDDVGGDGGDPAIRAEVVDLGGKQVQRTVVPAGSVEPFALYDWESGGRCAIVRANLTDTLTTELADGFVAAVPLPGAAGALPTPDESGITRLTTWQQATPLVPFDLLRPDPLPDGLTLDGIVLDHAPSFSTPGATSYGEVTTVHAAYRVSGGGRVLNYDQHVLGCNPPGMVDAETTTVQLAGRDVQRTEGTNIDGAPIVNYQWLDGEVCRSVFALVDEVTSDELLRVFVAAVGASDSPGSATPEPARTPSPADGTQVPAPATATPTRQPGAAAEFPVLTVWPDYAACGASVTLRGWNFEPGSTVAIYGGGRIGDSFAPVADDASVGDDGAFETTVAVERIVGDCTNSAQRDGQEYRIAAATGSSLTKSDFSEGPGAATVFTLSTTAPAKVAGREPLPSCGVEEQFVEDGMRGPAGPKAEMRGCFADEVAKRRPAEFRSFQPATDANNFETVAYIFRTTGDGAMTVIEDRTHDGTGTGGWTTSSCRGLVLNDNGEFEFDSCSDPVPLVERSGAYPAPATSEPVLVLSPDYGTCEETVVAWGWNFTPNSTAAIFGGPFPGDNFGAVIEALTVRDDGTFAIQLPLDLLVGACSGSVPTEEGAQFTVWASTGESDAKDVVVPDGPQAGTVWTYTTTVPATIRERAPLPSCGTERQMMVWDNPGEVIGPDRAVRECFFDTWTQRGAAEFVSHDLTSWPRAVTTIYRTSGDGVLWVYTHTRSDTADAGTWEAQSCVRYEETGDDAVFTPNVCDPEPLGE